MLRALAAPFPDILFCPTGGQSRASARRTIWHCLTFVSVGGSWVGAAAHDRCGRLARHRGIGTRRGHTEKACLIAPCSLGACKQRALLCQIFCRP